MGRLLILRHAQSVWNAAARWQGWADIPLSELGREQARQAGRALAGQGLDIEVIASSDLARARLTAALIAEETGFRGPVHVDPGLKEHDVGEWNGLTTNQIMSRWPGQMEAMSARALEAFPGGENLAHFQQRAREAVVRLAAMSAHQQGHVVAVSHGGVMTVVEQWIGVWRPERRHPNLSGWWLAPTFTNGEVGLEPLSSVQLLSSATSTGRQGRPAQAVTEVA